MALSKTQLDKVGLRLRASGTEDRVGDADRAAFDEYRAGLMAGLAEVEAAVGAIAGSLPSSRPKTLQSTLAKLTRQPNTRLSQIQDIVGCRIVVSDIDAQDAAVQAVISRYPNHVVDDRREEHQNGYRAVHVIVRLDNGNYVEVQVRTTLQNDWANLCERLADRFDPAFKYGGGTQELREPLMQLSEDSATVDRLLREVTLRELALTPRISRLVVMDDDGNIDTVDVSEEELAELIEEVRQSTALIRQVREVLARVRSLGARLEDALRLGAR